MKNGTLLVLMLIIAVFPTFNSYANSMQKEIYQKLDSIRDNKKQQLIDYLKRIRNNANIVKSDNVMIEFFHLKRKYYKLQKITPPPEMLIKEIDKLKINIRDHYLWNYLAFYDILFIDKDGDIFYTVRQQSDYHKNIFQGTLAETALSKELKNHPLRTFTDYQYYPVSDEPSAFFIVPVMNEKKLSGWIIFQCAINKINNIFSQTEEFGSTGEVFLVNKENFMLTDSRFCGESGILKMHLSNENISNKFREKKGHKIVVDYRGFRVFTSFSVFNIADSEWLLISKIDEDEIITKQYRKYRKELKPSIINCFNEKRQTYRNPAPVYRKTVEVDMDEFRKVKNREILHTFGVSTCTAIVVSYPKKFAYMAHISNLDRIYDGHTTDLIGNVLKRIKTFDLLKNEIRNLRITVVANHMETIINVIDKLVDGGVFLSQIKFMYNDRATYANLFHDYINNQTHVGWTLNRKSDDMLHQCDSDVETIGQLTTTLLDNR